MTTNESTTDRIIRLLAAVVAVIAAFALGAGTIAGVALLALAVILLVTATVGFCPLYRLFGVGTRRVSATTGRR